MNVILILHALLVLVFTVRILLRDDEVTLSEVLAWRYYQRIWHNVIATIGPVL